MVIVALIALVGLSYFCGMLDTYHRDPLPYGLIVTGLAAVALYYQYREVL